MIITPGAMTLGDWRAIYEGESAALDAGAWNAIDASAAAVARIVAKGAPVYGINTGFGKLASVRIVDSELSILQRNIVLSHAPGTGAPSPRSEERSGGKECVSTGRYWWWRYQYK